MFDTHHRVMSTGEATADEATGEGSETDGGRFGRPVADLPAGGGLFADFRRAVTYPLTASAGTFLRGGLLAFASLFLLPAPLLVGYVATAARAISGGASAPSFDDWQRLYRRGVELTAVALAFLFGWAFLLALFGVATGTEPASGSELSPVGAVLVVGLYYALPWVVGVYGVHSARGFGHATPWRWLVSANYLLTYVATAVFLFVAYFVFLASFLTIVGWAFVGFGVLVVLGAFLGQRYRTYCESRDSVSATETTPSDGLDFEAVSAALGSLLSFATARIGSSGSSVGSATEAGEEDEDGTEPDDGSTGTDYARYRERARTVEVDGGIERLAAGDGDRVAFLALAAERDGETAREAFERAADRWDGISHNPHVATVFDTGDEPTPWVAFDPLDGPLTAVGGDLSGAEAVAVVEAVGDALSTGRMYNIAHGDVCPADVAIERAGGTASARERVDAALGGWGVRSAVAEATDADGPSVRYRAPEQFGDGPTDARVDVYQLAALAHYALFGEPPFAAVDAADLATPDRDVSWSPPGGDGVTAEAVEVLARGLSSDPEDRHDDTDEFVRALRAALA